MNEIKRNFSKWLYWFVLGVAIIFVYKVLDNFTAIGNTINNFFDTITPFLVGTLFASLLYLPASRIEKGISKTKNKFIKKHARGIGVFITIIITLLIIIILINVILPVVVDSIVELVNNFQGYWNKTVENYSNLPEDSIFKNEQITEIIKSFGENIQNINLKQYINPERITGYVKSVLGVASGIFDVFVTIIVSIYILLERGKIIKFFQRLGEAIFSEKVCNKIGEYFSSTNKIFFKFISSQLVDACVVGILVTIAMSLMKVKYAVLLGFLIGLFNIIPYFGAIIAVAISIVITLITGGLSQAIGMSIVVIILQQIDANIINPRITGSSLEISPLLVIFAVTIGGAYFGVVGMFLAVPVIAVIKIIVNDFIDFKMEEKRKNAI